MNYIAYNPLSNSKQGEQIANIVKEKLAHRFADLELLDMTSVEEPIQFIKRLTSHDNVVILGGDGTLNRLVNVMLNFEDLIKGNLYVYQGGTGNDFVNDVKQDLDEDNLVPLNKYLVKIPRVEVNGKTYAFINNAALGVDGEVCRIADEKAKKKKKINYTKIAINLVLFKYKPTKARILVDGKEILRNRVYLASAFNGKYYGGGMLAAPGQDRLSDELTFVCMHSAHKIYGLMTFAKIFTGEHVLRKKVVDLVKGKTIEVFFEKPCALQIDGEVVLGVTHYKAYKI